MVAVAPLLYSLAQLQQVEQAVLDSISAYNLSDATAAATRARRNRSLAASQQRVPPPLLHALRRKGVCATALRVPRRPDPLSGLS